MDTLTKVFTIAADFLGTEPWIVAFATMTVLLFVATRWFAKNF